MTTAHQPPQHDDPTGEARAQLLQALAVVATVGEAGARWAATGIQNRAANAEKAAQADRAATAAHAEAERLAAAARAAQDRADRQLIDRAFTDWLDGADLRDTARLWRTATLRAAGDPRSREAMALAEDRLRHLRPGLMDAYDRPRAAGTPPAEAMRAAAYQVWQTANTAGDARAHGNQPDQPGVRAGANGRTLGPGGSRLDEMDAAVRTEVAELAQQVDPEALDRLQRQWRSAGRAPAADAAGLLAQFARDAHTADVLPAVVADQLEQTAARHLSGYAGRQRRTATLDAGSPDITATPVDEHNAGLTAATIGHGAADHDEAGAAQRTRFGRAFPPLTVNQVSPLVAGKQPAPTVATRRKDRTR